MKIFLTGGTGFVGNAVAKRLLERGHSVRALVRRGSESKLAVADKCEIRLGEFTDNDSLDRAISGCDAVVHLVGIIKDFPSKGITFDSVMRKGTIAVGDAAKKAGVKRFVHMSALGARENAATAYFRAKWAAEEYLRTSGLDFTIFRPSVIIGPRGEFFGILKKLCSAPVTPVIGDGKYKLQPVALENVVECFVRALETPQTIGKIYSVGGPEAMSFNEMLAGLGEVLGKKTRLIHMPFSPMKLATKLFESVPGWPVTSDQLKMMNESLDCDNSPAVRDLGIILIPFRRSCVIALDK